MENQGRRLLITASSIVLICMTTPSEAGELIVKSISDVNSIAHYPGSGGVVISNNKHNKDKIVCVAPPAQSAEQEALKSLLGLKASGTAGTNTGAGESKAGGEVDFNRTTEAVITVAKLYEQTERSLLLQYSLYRLCEAHLNGMFSIYKNPLPDLLKLKLQTPKSDTKTLDQIENHILVLIDVQKEINVLEDKLAKLNNNSTNNDKQKQEEIKKYQEQIDAYRSTYYLSAYESAFDKILDTAVELTKLEVQKFQGERDKAAADLIKMQAKLKEQELMYQEKLKEAEKQTKSAQEEMNKIEEKALDKLFTQTKG